LVDVRSALPNIVPHCSIDCCITALIAQISGESYRLKEQA